MMVELFANYFSVEVEELGLGNIYPTGQEC
jgi:hypothetical protein